MSRRTTIFVNAAFETNDGHFMSGQALTYIASNDRIS